MAQRIFFSFEITGLQIIDLPQLIDDYGVGYIKSRCGKIYWIVELFEEAKTA